MSDNVRVYAMFASGIIARSAYHWQIWVEACGGTEQAVTAYAVRLSKNSHFENFWG